MGGHLSPELRGQLATIARARLAWITGPAGRDTLRRLTKGPGWPQGPNRSLVQAVMQARTAWAGGSGEADLLPVIAEVKRRSPSAGAIAADADALQQALRYRQAGACAISVLAEGEFFGGSPEDVAAVAQAVDRPVLFKDVVVHPLQLELARACGACAVLLIAAVLRPDSLAQLVEQAQRLGLETLVEVHTEPELAVALQVRPAAIGINNRDLTTFQVDPARAERLLPQVPNSLPCIAESGYRTPEQAARALAAGAAAVLIGEALMRSPDPVAFLRAIRRVNGPGGVKASDVD